jgi:signal transduction protein with GAF and PtsI domain
MFIDTVQMCKSTFLESVRDYMNEYHKPSIIHTNCTYLFNLKVSEILDDDDEIQNYLNTLQNDLPYMLEKSDTTLTQLYESMFDDFLDFVDGEELWHNFIFVNDKGEDVEWTMKEVKRL